MPRDILRGPVPDGIPDLVLKFSVQELVAYLKLRDVAHDTLLELEICAKMDNGINWIHGTDCVIIKNKGVKRLLDAVVEFLPSPIDLPPVIGQSFEGEEIERKPHDEGRLAALAFKVVTDRHMGKMIYFRVYSGMMKRGTYVLNSTQDKSQRVGRLMQMHANHQENRETIYSGDIGVAVGLSDTFTGDTLCDPDNPIILEAIEFPSPVIAVSISPESRSDAEKLANGLLRLSEEDPTFTVGSGEERGETVIAGMPKEFTKGRSIGI